MNKKQTIKMLSIGLFGGVLGIWALINFIGIRNKIKLDNYSDEEDSVYEHKQHILQLATSAGTMTHILNFMLFGINTYYIVETDAFGNNALGIVLLLAFINGALAMYLEVANINLVKKMEPEKMRTYEFQIQS